jgi:flagellar motor switch protein FliN/FliY
LAKARPVGEHFQKPMKADEIESLLRSAREGKSAPRSDVVSKEPLGPGDVQHLRNSAPGDDSLTDAGWPYDAVPADELLLRAEHHLAAAMSQDTEDSRHDTRATQPLHSFPALAPFAGPTPPAAAGLPLSVIGDIELDVTLELGRAELTIEDLLALREGSVVTLDKEAGEPIDILANGKLVARGEVIVVDERFCVRICEVVGQNCPGP